MVTLLTWTPIFGWYMARLLGKNEHHKNMPYDEIDLWAQNVDSIEGFIVNTNWEGLCDHLKRRMFTLDSYNFCILGNCSSETWNDNLYDLHLLTGWDDSWADQQPECLWSYKCPHKTTHLISVGGPSLDDIEIPEVIPVSTIMIIISVSSLSTTKDLLASMAYIFHKISNFWLHH